MEVLKRERERWGERDLLGHTPIPGPFESPVGVRVPQLLGLCSAVFLGALAGISIRHGTDRTQTSILM